MRNRCDPSLSRVRNGLEFVRPAYGGTVLSAWQYPARYSSQLSAAEASQKPEAAEGSVEEKEAPVDADALKAKLLTQRKRSLKLLTWKVPMSS